MKNHPLLATLLMFQAVFAAFGQQPSATPPPLPQQSQQKPDDLDVVRITTNLVQVDAVVTDKSGKVVNDLKSGDVELYEDGKKKDITNFQFYSNESAAPVEPEKVVETTPVDKTAPPLPAARLKREDVRRTIAVVVDDLGLSFENVEYVRRALKKFVEEDLQPGDLVAILRSRGGMGALQQFTSDKRQLLAAIDQIKWFPSGRNGLTAIDPISVLQQGQAKSVGAATGVDDAKEDLGQFRGDVLSSATLRSISYVIRGLNDLPGRKSVLLISDGLNILGDPSANRRVLEDLKILTDEANRAAVVIYTMDSRGVQPTGFTAADNTGFIDPRTGHRMTMRQDQLAQQLSIRAHDFSISQDGLIDLAEGTGGLAIRNMNNLAGGIKKVMDDQKGYYLIAYRPDESTFDANGRRTFHKLSLKVTRPGKFDVRIRTGFFGVEDRPRTTAPPTLAQQMVTAVTSPFAASGVRLQLTPFFANDPTIGSFMRAMLHIEAKDLTFVEQPDHQQKCVFDVLAMTFGGSGIPIDLVGKTYAVTLPEKLFRQVQREGLVYYVTVPIKRPGAYQLRTSLRDTASQRIGSASEFIQVPDLTNNRLALSGLTVSGLDPRQAADATSPRPASANQSPQSVSNGELLDQSVEASAALRHFSQGMLMDYLFMIYNARLDKRTNLPQLTTQLRLFRDGKQVFAGQVNPVDMIGQKDMQRIVAAGRIQLGSVLTPGEYVAQVVVTDLLADSKHRMATQWIDFEIIK